MPSRTEITINVTLSEAERARYDALRRVLHERARDGSLAPQQRRVQLLSALTRLRQLACHAALDEVGRDLVDRPSSKLEALGSLWTDLKDNRHRALVFSQFTRLLDLVEPVLAAAGISFVRLDGSTSTAERGRAVDAFQSGAVDVFLLSLKAGGFGLNLTAADYVVHLDPWWNPAAEAQATDRAHRIGQTRPVTVYRLVAAGTIEDAVVQMQADKRALFAAVLDDAEVGAAATAWSEDDLLSLLTGADAARAADAGDDVEAVEEKPAPRRSSRARGRRGSK
ncbi:MAG: SWF/SNF helicase family protein [Deltaproteobacteria bacterium]|nr:SWF/SNF helicase family protein [Deltaproteobacteria bacterium]